MEDRGQDGWAYKIILQELCSGYTTSGVIREVLQLLKELDLKIAKTGDTETWQTQFPLRNKRVHRPAQQIPTEEESESDTQKEPTPFRVQRLGNTRGKTISFNHKQRMPAAEVEWIQKNVVTLS